jgi:hypothetical protein
LAHEYDIDDYSNDDFIEISFLDGCHHIYLYKNKMTVDLHDANDSYAYSIENIKHVIQQVDRANDEMLALFNSEL